jgi:hypothetical protein
MAFKLAKTYKLQNLDKSMEHLDNINPRFHRSITDEATEWLIVRKNVKRINPT